MKPHLASTLRFVFTLTLFAIAGTAQESTPGPATGGGLPDRWVDEAGDRMHGKLTLDPPGDRALDVESGSVYKAGKRFLHTRGGAGNVGLGTLALTNVTLGTGNTALGSYALTTNTTGRMNSAVGYRALRFNVDGSLNAASGYRCLTNNTSGSFNVGLGAFALFANTSGTHNTACGYRALGDNTSGVSNTASGHRALGACSTGYGNTATGARALRYVTTGSSNVAVGYEAGVNLTTEDDNIAIGNPSAVGDSGAIRIGVQGIQTSAFLAGVHGTMTSAPSSMYVFADANGQLGTQFSSRRFKRDIEDMGDATRHLRELRPVVFHFRDEAPDAPLEYGLIAEEVAEVFPELVVRDAEGEPLSIRYHVLSAMLLNEIQRQATRLEEQEHELAALGARLAAIESERASELASRR